MRAEGLYKKAAQTAALPVPSLTLPLLIAGEKGSGRPAGASIRLICDCIHPARRLHLVGGRNRFPQMVVLSVDTVSYCLRKW